MATFTVTIPNFVKSWKNASPQGVIKMLNQELDTITDEIEQAVKALTPVGEFAGGKLRDSIEVDIASHGDRSIEIEVKSDSKYFWQQEEGGSLPRRSPGPMIFPPSFSPFAGVDDAGAALRAAKGTWDNVFRPKGSKVILGERSDGEIDVLFIIAEQVTQEGQHYARRGLNSMKPEVRRIARNALRRYVRGKS